MTLPYRFTLKHAIEEIEGMAIAHVSGGTANELTERAKGEIVGFARGVSFALAVMRRVGQPSRDPELGRSR